MISGILKAVRRGEGRTTKRSRPTRLTSAERSGQSVESGGRNYTKGCLLVFVAALLYAGWVETMSQMKKAERFALVALEVRGIRVLDGDEVLQASALSVGDNIFAVDLDSVATRLEEELVWVRSARVERKPPDRLVVWVDERRRQAWMEISNRMFGVDEDGVLLPERPLSAETSKDLDLPVIRDVRLEDVDLEDGMMAGEAVVDSTLGAMLSWWSLVREHDHAFGAQISELRPLGKHALRVTLAGDGLEIRLPLHGQALAEQLEVLTTALPAVFRDIADPAYVDLRFLNQMVVGTTGAALRGGSSAKPAQAVSTSARGDHRG